MRWLLRACRLPATVSAMILAALLMLLLRGRAQPLPSLVAGRLVPVPLAAAASLPLLIELLRCCHSLPAAMTRTCVRPVAVLVPTMSLVLPAGAAAVTTVVVTGGAAIEIARDSLGLCGLLLIGLSVRRSAAAVALPLVFLMVAFLAGTDAAGAPFGWAWPLRAETDPTAWLVVTVTWAIGAGSCWLRRSWWVDDAIR